jgi:hypothetical protein
VVKDLIGLSINFEQLKPSIVLTLFNIKGYFDEIGDSKSMMNGVSVGFGNRGSVVVVLVFCWRRGADSDMIVFW